MHDVVYSRRGYSLTVVVAQKEKRRIPIRDGNFNR